MSYPQRGKTGEVYGVQIDKYALTGDVKNTSYKVGYGGVDSTATQSTILYTTEAGTSLFHVQELIVVAQLITTHTSVASISLGTNSTAFDNLLAITAQTGLTATGHKLTTVIPATTVSVIAASTAIYFKVTTASVGAVETYAIYLRGYYEDYGTNYVTIPA